MLKDIGFWNSKDEYLEDIQEIDEMEMCSLCKHFDCNSKGEFICSIDGEILQHENEGAGCQSYEEYEDE